jgi:hypothetical protein
VVRHLVKAFVTRHNLIMNVFSSVLHPLLLLSLFWSHSRFTNEDNSETYGKGHIDCLSFLALLLVREILREFNTIEWNLYTKDHQVSRGGKTAEKSCDIGVI